MKLTGTSNNFWAQQISYEDFVLKEGEKYIGKHGVFSSNNFKTRARINTSIPRYSRRESSNNENYKPIDLFQPISSNEMHDPTRPQEQKVDSEIFTYHLEGNNLPEFLQRPKFFVKTNEKIRKNETSHNNFFEKESNPTSMERILLESNQNHQKQQKNTSIEKPTSMNNIRPNTADMDYKMVFHQRGHRMFNKGMKVIGPNEEKKENGPSKPQIIKRAGTSNLLFRKSAKNRKPTDGNIKPEFGNSKGFQVNLFEKYQNFLDEKRKKLDQKFEELRDVIRNTKNLTKNKEENSTHLGNKQDLPEFFKKEKEQARTFSTNFFIKKPLFKKNPENNNKDSNNQTSSPTNKHENESKLSTAISTTKKKGTTIGNYELGPIIGKGSYAIVRLGIDASSSEKVAVKTYEKYKLFDPQKKKNVQREISILQKINHPNIIHLIKIIESPRTINLVMEFISNTSMHGYIKTFENRRIPEKEVRYIFKQIVEGINYLHLNNFVHRDIKLENILINKTNKEIKIIDFGFSVCIQPDKKLCMFCGTPSYMAPEIVSKQDYSGKCVDVWALGILLYTMLCGKFPFKASEDKELYKKISLGYFEIPSHVPYGAEKLIKSILKVRPSERYTANDILNDNWIKEKS